MRAAYQADVEEGLGAAVAIVVDMSGSMRDNAPGDTRPKHVVAQEAPEAMLDATDAFIAKRPDFPIKIGIYEGKILAEAPGVGEREPVKR